MRLGLRDKLDICDPDILDGDVGKPSPNCLSSEAMKLSQALES